MKKKDKKTPDILQTETQGVVDTQQSENQNIVDIVDGMELQQSDATAIKKQNQQANAMKGLAILLYIISITVIFALTIGLAVSTFKLAPYYSFWPFLGVVFIGILAIAFISIMFTVTRKKSKHSLRYQSVAVLTAFFCLTCGFAIILEVVFPDILKLATQGTLYADDMYYRGEEQIDENIALNRQFIRFNILNGNMTPEYSYKEMSACEKEDGIILSYKDKDIQDSVKYYKNLESKNGGTIKEIVTEMDGLRKELYDFIYYNYTLLDFDYAMQYKSVAGRQAFTLAMCDKTYDYYTQLCKEGFSNPRLENLRKTQFASMDQDGYVSFDDPLLLFAQLDGRMTIPVVLRLILDNTYSYSQPIYDKDGNLDGYDGFLYELYEPDYVKEHWNDENAIRTQKGDVRVSDDGYFMNISGYVKRPIKWCVLDMDGNNMSIVEGASLDGLGDIGGLLGSLLGNPKVTAILDELIKGELPGIIEAAANGASLGIGLYFDDAGAISMSVVPSNVRYGVLGYMQMSWMNSNNLLVGIINLLSAKGYLYMFGAVGILFVLTANILRESAVKKKEEVKKMKLSK